LQNGDEVTVSGPFGGFVFDERRDRKMVLIAGGIGITPFMSMIQYATNNNLTNEITLIYNCSNQNDMPFVEQLINIEKRNPYFNIIFTVSNGPTDRFNDEYVKSGRITDEIIKDAVKGIYDDKTYFICGPSVFMSAMANILYKSGVLEDKVMTEAFGQGSDQKREKAHSWPSNVYTLGAIGVILATTAVMATDLLNNLPVYSLFNSSNQESLTNTNGRQDELDKLVNSLPALNDNKPSSVLVTNGASSNSNNTSSSQSKSTPTQTTTKVPTPASKPAPVCTTTQSGVTTCV
jgi:ferredoxin-NADP reductase